MARATSSLVAGSRRRAPAAPCAGNTFHSCLSEKTNCPSSTMKFLLPLPSELALITRQRSTAPGRMKIVVGWKAPLTAVGGGRRDCM